MTNEVGTGSVKLVDGTVLELKILIVDVKEIGFSPFGGINFDPKIIGGISVSSVPEHLKKDVANKPLTPPEPPKDGWEIIDITEQKPAMAQVVVESSKGKYLIKTVAEAVMASRNMNYKSTRDEPVYWLSWVYKISWKPYKEQSK